MSYHDMKIRYKMTSLLACKNVYFFLLNIRTRPLCSVRFGSEVPCSANFRSVRRFGYSTSTYTLYMYDLVGSNLTCTVTVMNLENV